MTQSNPTDSRCSKCGKHVDPIDMFTGNRCMACFEKDYNKLTDAQKRPDFIGTIDRKKIKF